MSLTVIKPVPVTPAMLLSSTAAEASEPEWSAATTYAADARVSVAADRRVYQSVQAGNLNHPPAANVPTWWVDVGATNRWAMFDGALGTATSDAAAFTVVLAPGAVSAVALMQVQAASVRVQMLDTATGNIVYDRTVDMGAQTITDWWEWTTAPFDYRGEMVLTDLPLYPMGQITCTVQGNGMDAAQCSEMVLGTTYTIGTPQHGGRLGLVDYSRKETDEWGATTLVQRSYARTLDLPLALDAAELAKTYSVLAGLRATPCVWVPSAEARYGALVVYGWIGEFSIDLQTRDYQFCTLQIKGMT